MGFEVSHDDVGITEVKMKVEVGWEIRGKQLVIGGM